METMLVAGFGQCSWDTLFLVDTYPQADAKAEATGVVSQGGGPVATALIALERMGVRTRFSGLAGDDEAGRKIEASLSAEGVDVSPLVLRENCSSQIAFIAVERDSASRTVFWQRASGDTLLPSEIRADFLHGASLLMLDGLMHDASISLAREARGLGIPVLLDAGRVREGMLELASLSDHVVGSEVFGREVGMDPARPDDFLELALERFSSGLTITLGNRGCVHYGQDGFLKVPAYNVAALDTTGAGDVFHAGFAYGVLNGFALLETLRFASASAALSTLGLGGRAALPGINEVNDLIASNRVIQ